MQTVINDDEVVSFQIEDLDVRGSVVKLGPLLDSLLSRHRYPDPVAQLLSEVIVLTILLGTSMKLDGTFIVQTKSDGPVDMLVASLKSPNSIRAYARYKDDGLKHAVAQGKTAPAQLLGSGLLAMTIDQGIEAKVYQGVVQLDGSSLEDIAKSYFHRSEQIPSEVRLTAKKIERTRNSRKSEYWRGGGLLLQFLPDARIDKQSQRAFDEDGKNEIANFEVQPNKNLWYNASILAKTVKYSEILDPNISNNTLIYRLFNEHETVVFPGRVIFDKCTCSRERIYTILQNFTAEEISECTEHGVVRVNCEFCSKSYEFDPKTIYRSDGV